MNRKSEYFPPFKDEGEVMARWGDAHLIKYLDEKLVLKGGAKEDRFAAWEWISMFLNEAVVREVGLKAQKLPLADYTCRVKMPSVSEMPKRQPSIFLMCLQISSVKPWDSWDWSGGEIIHRKFRQAPRGDEIVECDPAAPI